MKSFFASRIRKQAYLPLLAIATLLTVLVSTTPPAQSAEPIDGVLRFDLGRSPTPFSQTSTNLTSTHPTATASRKETAAIQAAFNDTATTIEVALFPSNSVANDTSSQNRRPAEADLSSSQLIPVPPNPPPISSNAPGADSVLIPPDPTASALAEPVLSSLQGYPPIFSGGSDSLVAIAIGNAEGTRTPDGSKTSAYWGHVDPGNGVWNLGSFSYQHGAKSPQEADRLQLQRLEKQAIALLQQSREQSLSLSLEALLNGLDLANQAPKAALSTGGYIDRLAQANQQGFPDADAIQWARVHAFIDPQTQTWDAPGLGNRGDRIQADQERRRLAISQVVQAKQVRHSGKLR